MVKSMRFRLSILTAAIAVSLCIAAAPASAQQTGLVNLTIEGNTVQVPIAIAANVCDVNVAILVGDLRDDAASCTADGKAVAIAPSAEGDGMGNGEQTGLVNVIIADNIVQVPVAAAVNICDVNVAVLVAELDDRAAVCEADASSRARGR
jgi:hypothetical protein